MGNLDDSVAHSERGAEAGSLEVNGGGKKPFVRKMFLGASITALMQAGSGAVGFAIAVALARLLGSRGYGFYVFSLAWASTLTIPAGLGLNKFVVRGVAQYEHAERFDFLRGLVTRANVVVLAASTAIATLGSLAALLFIDGPLRWVFVLAMVTVPLNALTLLRQSSMQALGRVVTGQIPEYVIRPIILVVGVGLLFLCEDRLRTPAIAMSINVVAIAVAFAAGAIALTRAIPQRVKAASARYEMRTWINAALPMMLIGGIWQLNGYVSTIAVGILAGPQSAGIYSSVEKGGEIIVLLLVAANMPFAPIIARLRAQGDFASMEHAAERIAQATAAASIPVVLFFVAVPGLYLGLFGSAFSSGTTALRILALGQLFNAAAGPVGSALIMTGHERSAFWGVGIGLVVTIVSSVILIPILGVTGAAIADGASFVTWNLILVLLCRRRLGINATAIPLLAMRKS